MIFNTKNDYLYNDYYYYKMNINDLTNNIILGINKSFEKKNPNYSFMIFDNNYYKSQDDIKLIGRKILINFKLNRFDPYIDYIETLDYIIFKYKNYYVIINYCLDIWEMAQYKLLIVKTRNEALTYRYGD